MMHWVAVILVGAIIGLLAGLLTKRGGSGFIINALVGIAGSWVGAEFLSKYIPTFGLNVAGIALVPALVGAIIVTLIVSFILRKVLH